MKAGDYLEFRGRGLHRDYAYISKTANGVSISTSGEDSQVSVEITDSQEIQKLKDFVSKL